MTTPKTPQPAGRILAVLLALIAAMLVVAATLATTTAGADTAIAQDERGVPQPFLLELEPYTTGISRPVGIAHTGMATDGRLFVLEQRGVIRLVDVNGALVVTPFLDIHTRVYGSGAEQGLLGLAFHPDYATNGTFYVNYTGNDPTGVADTVISRFQTSSTNSNIADPNSEEIIMRYEQPYPNHNGGGLVFGLDDGYLYIGSGDGGHEGDPDDRGQDTTTLLGKILRIDVDSDPANDPPDCYATGNYKVPADNPLADGAGGDCDEIWAYGLRNPWRLSFDRLTHDLYFGDVGQADWEEVNVQAASSSGGENYGWRCYEGNHEFNLLGCGAPEEYVFPVAEYPHPILDDPQPGFREACAAVVGGYVYRGDDYPLMAGNYLYADFCSGIFSGLRPTAEGWYSFNLGRVPAPTQPITPTSFGEDANGELYVTDLTTGSVLRIVAVPAQNIYMPAVFNSEGD